MYVRSTLLSLGAVLLLSGVVTDRVHAGSWSIDRGNSWLGVEGYMGCSAQFDGTNYGRASMRAYADLQLLKQRKDIFHFSARAQTGTNPPGFWNPTRNSHTSQMMKVAGSTVSLDRNWSSLKEVDYSRHFTLFRYDKWILVAGIVPVSVEVKVTLDFDTDLESQYTSSKAIIRLGASTGLTGSLTSAVYFAIPFGGFAVPTRVAVRFGLTLLNTSLTGTGECRKGGPSGRIDLRVVAARVYLVPKLQYLAPHWWHGLKWYTWKQSTLIDKSYGKFTRRLF